jgi:hypothetical protein
MIRLYMITSANRAGRTKERHARQNASCIALLARIRNRILDIKKKQGIITQWN